MTPREQIERAKLQIEAVMRRNIKNLSAALIEATPAHTGRTRCSFVATIGATAVDTDPKLGSEPRDYDPAGQSAVDQIAEMVESLQPGDTLYLTSDFPNATRLEDGDRHEPPHGMVARAAATWGSDGG